MKPVDAIVLAAGASRRMGPGRHKLLLDVHGQPMLRRILTTIRQTSIRRIIVITGTQHAAIHEALRTAEEAEHIHLINNPAPERGMLSSVRCGLSAMNEEVDGVAVFLGDQPAISSQSIESLLKAWSNRPLTVTLAYPTFEGSRGHPLIVALSHRDQIMNSFEDTGLRGLRETLSREQILGHPVDNRGVVEDVDTPEDYKRVLALMKDSGSQEAS